VLPSPHPFEKELRAINTTGNSIPTFRFGFAGAANGQGTIKGSITVRVRGQYALGHVRVGKGSSKNLTTRILATLPHKVMGATQAPVYADDSDGDDDEESEDEAPVRTNTGSDARTVPVRANAVATRVTGLK